jgi:hypothetical protein
MKNKLYNDLFYENQVLGSINSAKIVLPKMLEVLPKINSAVDFGCGLGAWLSVLNKLGVNEIKGYDGPWINKDRLLIPKESFTEIEFDREFDVDKRYDLAISVEVAEHILPKFAERFIETLCKASDIILFSAAIPLQGGTEHINEQWPEYWVNIFEKNNYVVMDFLRSQIWNEKSVEYWYKQNILVFIKKSISEKIKIVGYSRLPLSLVHPQCYLKTRDFNRISLRQLYKLTIKRTLKKIFRKV